MGECTKCRNETSLLFDTGRGKLCWLCSSREKVGALEHETEDAAKQYVERRAWKRYPVNIHIKLSYGTSEESKIIFPGVTVNISEGGMCVEWMPCEVCRGYVPGDVHPACIFAPYAHKSEGSDFFYVSMFLSEEEIVNISAKAVFVIKRDEETEYIGVSFFNLDGETREKIREIIEKVVDNG